MPLYEYECEACGERFELIRRFSDPEVDVCARCGKGPVRRLFSSPAIQFKGSGWYITDYARKGGAEKPSGKTTDKTEKPAEASSEKKTETPAKTDAAASATSSSSAEKKP